MHLEVYYKMISLRHISEFKLEVIMKQEYVQAEPASKLHPIRFRKKYIVNDIRPATNIFFLTTFWFYTALCALPLLLVVIVSFTDEDAINLHGYSFFPAKLSLIAYKLLFARDQSIAHSYMVTINVTLIGTFLGLIITSLYAFPISRKSFYGARWFTVFAMITMLFNGGLLPSYILWTNYLHVANTLWGLILPGLLLNGYFILLMRTFFSTSIPNELYEAAEIDGSDQFKLFTKIALPLSLPVMATIALFYLIMYWNDWMNSMLYIQGSDNISIQFVLIKLMSNIQYLQRNANAGSFVKLSFPKESFKMAMSVAAIGPIVLAYPFLQRFFVKGLTIGAIKG